jgi:hypothetical protein
MLPLRHDAFQIMLAREFEQRFAVVLDVIAVQKVLRSRRKDATKPLFAF